MGTSTYPQSLHSSIVSLIGKQALYTCTRGHVYQHTHIPSPHFICAVQQCDQQGHHPTRLSKYATNESSAVKSAFLHSPLLSVHTPPLLFLLLNAASLSLHPNYSPPAILPLLPTPSASRPTHNHRSPHTDARNGSLQPQSASTSTPRTDAGAATLANGRYYQDPLHVHEYWASGQKAAETSQR